MVEGLRHEFSACEVRRMPWLGMAPFDDEYPRWSVEVFV